MKSGKNDTSTSASSSIHFAVFSNNKSLFFSRFKFQSHKNIFVLFCCLFCCLLCFYHKLFLHRLCRPNLSLGASPHLRYFHWSNPPTHLLVIHFEPTRTGQPPWAVSRLISPRGVRLSLESNKKQTKKSEQFKQNYYTKKYIRDTVSILEITLREIPKSFEGRFCIGRRVKDQQKQFLRK